MVHPHPLARASACRCIVARRRRLCTKLIRPMITVARRSPMRQLSKFVQLDHACLGGERNGSNPGARVGEQASLLGGDSGRWDRDHPTYYPAIEPVRSFDGASIKDWQRHLAADAEMLSNGLFYFRRVVDAGHAYTVLDTGRGRAAHEAQGVRWVDALLGNLKRTIGDSHHAISRGKYAHLYLADAVYRLNHRFDARAIMPQLVRAMALSCASLGQSQNCVPSTISMVSAVANQEDLCQH